MTVIDSLFPLSKIVTFADAPLADGVGHVLLMRTQEQMIGTNTSRRVTVMADEQPSRNRAVVKFVGVAMGVDTRSHVSIPTPVVGCCPKPARVSLSNVLPKPLSNRTSSASVEARLGTILALGARDKNRKGRVTNAAGSFLSFLSCLLCTGWRAVTSCPGWSAPKGNATVRAGSWGCLAIRRAFAWYTFHVLDLLTRLRAIPRPFIAARGFSVSNYNTKGA